MFDVQYFSYENSPVTVLIDKDTGEIWFDAAQVCNVLGYERKASSVIEKLDDDEKRLVNKEEQKGYTDSVPPLGGFQDKNFVSEPGLYKLIFQSRKQVAKNFTRFVTHEILPEIRKTGHYQAQSQSNMSEVEVMVRQFPIIVRRILELGKRFQIFQDGQEYIDENQKLMKQEGQEQKQRIQDNENWLCSLEKHWAKMETMLKAPEFREWMARCQYGNEKKYSTRQQISQEQAEQLKTEARQIGKSNTKSLWSKFRKHFCLSHYLDLPEEKFSDALAWIHSFGCGSDV